MASYAHLDAIISATTGTFPFVLRILLSLSNGNNKPLNIIWGISKSGIKTYTVTAELNADEIFKPSTFAIHEVLKSTNQNGISIFHSISRTTFPRSTNVNVWIADRLNRIMSFDNR